MPANLMEMDQCQVLRHRCSMVDENLLALPTGLTAATHQGKRESFISLECMALATYDDILCGRSRSNNYTVIVVVHVSRIRLLPDISSCDWSPNSLTQVIV